MCDEIALMLSSSEVLGIIDPIDPENLQSDGKGVWTAKWAPPVPIWQIEALCGGTSGVHIVANVYQPDNLPNWAAVEFSVCADAVKRYKRFMNGESDFR